MLFRSSRAPPLTIVDGGRTATMCVDKMLTTRPQRVSLRDTLRAFPQVTTSIGRRDFNNYSTGQGVIVGPEPRLHNNHDGTGSY